MSENEIVVVVFDTETTTIPKDNLPVDHPEQAYPIQLAWIAADVNLQPVHERALIISPPKDIVMHPAAQRTHGKSLEHCWQHGVPFEEALAAFHQDCLLADIRAAYNIPFDDKVMANAYIRHTMKPGENIPAWALEGVEDTEDLTMDKLRALAEKKVFGKTHGHCVMKQATAFNRVPQGNGGYRNLKLGQVYRRLMGRPMLDAHDALGDVRGTLTVMREMMAVTPIPIDPNSI